jgi:tetratricopeptide (TPR) repeat protein
MLWTGKDDRFDHEPGLYQTAFRPTRELIDMKVLSLRPAATALAAALCLAPAVTGAQPQVDPLERARRLYNAGSYDEAIEAARNLAARAGSEDAARLLIGRALLERHRASSMPEDLAEARQALREVDPTTLSDRHKVDLVVGLGEALYLDGDYRAAAALLGSALGQAVWLTPDGREQLADWWATAMDRYAQTRPPDDRTPLYLEVEQRMATHLAQYPDSSSAPYWSAAAALARGDLDLAWDLAVAAWVRAPMTPDRGAALRADVDRLVVRGIVPERVKRLPGQPDPQDAANSLLAEWELTKEKWTRP